MTDGGVAALGGIYLVVIIFLVVLAVLWFLLPFAIFGTKDKLDTLIQETRNTNKELEAIRTQVLGAATPSDPASPGTPEKPGMLQKSGPHDEQLAKHEISKDDEKYVVYGRRHDKLDDALMVKYNISNDGEKYVFHGHRYDKIEDAIAYARKQKSNPE